MRSLRTHRTPHKHKWQRGFKVEDRGCPRGQCVAGLDQTTDAGPTRGAASAKGWKKLKSSEDGWTDPWAVRGEACVSCAPPQ